MSQQAAQRCVTSPLKAKLSYDKGKDMKTFIFTKVHLNDVNNPQIVEVAMIAVHKRDLTDHGDGDNTSNNTRKMKRYIDKLVLCFDAQKPLNLHSAAKSNLDWQRIRGSNKKPFDRSSVLLMNEFLKRQNRPICFVAHHGFLMDFPALKSEITALQMSLFATEEENLWIADTATACQDLDAPDQHKMHETTLDAIDYSMESLYLRYLKKRMPMETYTAEQYATCLMQLVDSISDQFINVVSIMKFSDVLPRDQKIARALFSTQSTENGGESVDQNEDPDRQADEYDIQTFVFLDLETTGLDTTTDNITELCLIAVDREQITELGNEVVEHEYGEFPKVPRVQDKLNILIDPLSMIPNEVSRITKIDKENLEVRNKKPFSYETSMILRSFLDRQAHPICLVAHNGDAFDYLILNNHLDRVKADQTIWKEIYCADSLTGVRELRQPCERRPNGLQYLMKEVGVHHSQLLPHSAEGDTIALMVVVKLFPQNLPIWLDQHKRRFK